MAFNPLGQANFFSSRVLNPFQNPWMQQWFRKLGRNELAFYGTGSLARTLKGHFDWRALKKPGNTRLSLGAAHVCDGEVRFFDSRDPADVPLKELHVLASAALPPAFPPIQIGEEWYFDGGVSNNTPIEALAGKLFESEKNTLVFLIDLWDRKNDVLPESFEDLLWRQKCIQYGSRKKAAEIVVERYNFLAKTGELKRNVRLDLCQLMLENKDGEPQFCFADADFSRETFERLRAQGAEDMMGALQNAEQVTFNERDLFKETDLLKKADLLQGPRASLYRLGSEGKWKASRTGHQHMSSIRNNLPPLFEPWMAWWKQVYG
jgi:NTE family protein